MLAILMMAGGQLLHAQEELAAAKEHVHCSHEASTDDCPADAPCCHLHLSGATVTTETTQLQVLHTFSHSLPILDETCLEGPRGEIDYPPQLS